MKSNYKTGRAITLVFALFFLAAAVYATVDRVNFKHSSVVTEGKVVSIITKDTSKLDRTFINITRTIEISVISYKDENGKEYRAEESPFFSKAPFPMGEMVKIRYDREFPEDGVVDSFVNLFGFVIMFYFIGIVFLLVSIYQNGMINAEKRKQMNMNGY